MVKHNLINEINKLINSEYQIKKDGNIYIITIFNNSDFCKVLRHYKEGKSKNFVLFVSGKNQLWLNPKPYYL